MEKWKPVFGYEKSYECSSLGRVRSIQRVVPHKRLRKKIVPEKILSHGIIRGYPAVCLYLNGAGRMRYVHRLVFEAFHGPAAPGMDINHKDFNKTNNRLENLEAVTRMRNVHHACLAHRRKLKISMEQREEIRRSEEKSGALAKRYGINRTHVWLIRGGCQPGRKPPSRI